MMYIIYGKDNCPWCDYTKVLLEGQYVFKNVQNDRMHFEEFQKEFPGAKTVPKIMRVNDNGYVIAKFNSYEKLVEEF